MSIEIPSVWKHRQCPSVPFSARVPALFARQCGNNASKSAGEENRHFLIRERDAAGRVGEQVSSQVAIDILTPSPPLALLVGEGDTGIRAAVPLQIQTLQARMSITQAL